MSNKSYDIICIGSATRDVFLNSSQLKIIESPEFTTGKAVAIGLGSKIEIHKIALTTGGGGTNAAVTFARQGFATACIGVIGVDSNGRDILDELQGESVDTQYFQLHSDDYTAYSVILVQDNGERSILSYKGEGQHFSMRKISFEKLESKWVFVDSLGGHYELLQNIFEWAKNKNIKVAINPGGKELEHGIAKLMPFLKQASVVIMNQEEAATLTGISYDKEDELLKKMDAIVEGIFVLTKGPAGVVVSDGQNIFRAAVPDSPVVERTGAGDAFSSGFTVEYIRSGDIAKAIQFATANASSVVTQYGGKAGILKKGEWGPWPLVEVKVN